MGTLSPVCMYTVGESDVFLRRGSWQWAVGSWERRKPDGEKLTAGIGRFGLAGVRS